MNLNATLDNGVKRIPRHGRLKIAFGDDDAYEYDVIAVTDNWYVIDASYRIDGKVPVDKQLAYDQERHNFIQAIVGAEYQKANKTPPVLSEAEAMTFLQTIAEGVAECRLFFARKSPSQPASQESMDIRFEQ